MINGGEEYLPFARSRIKAMLSVTLMPYASQQFKIGTASIKVNIEPGHEYIRIDDSPAVYQFFSTGPTLKLQTILGTPEFVISKGYSFSVSKNPKKTALPKDNFKAKVHGSSVEAGPANAGGTPKWPLLEMFGPFEHSFPIKENFQIEGITEYAYYPAGSSGKINGKNKLLNSWACSKQIEGLLSNSGAYYSQIDAPTGFANTFTRYATGVSTFDVDVTYDLSPGVGKGKYIVPDTDWYKRAAIKTVTHKTYGTRKFIIMSDISGVFHAYPVAVDTDMQLDEASAAAATRFEFQGIKTNVASNFDRKVDTPYPAWCRGNTGASSRDATINGDSFAKTIQRVPQYRWAFNSDASKACSVVYEDLKLGLNESHVDQTANKLDNKFFTFGSFELGKLPLYESLPGLLELNIHIGLLGPKLNEFEFTVTVAQEMQPTLTGKYIVGADYAWPIKDHAEKDDLILMTGSVYHASLVREKTPLIFNLKVNKTIIDIENFTADKIVRSFLVRASNQSYSINGGIYPNELYTWEDKLFLDESLNALKKGEAIFLAVDLRVLAFVVSQKYKVTQVTRYLMQDPQAINGALAFDAESAVRIQTYMRNKLEDEIILENSALDAELDSFFSNDSVQTMFKMPITERGGLYQVNADAPHPASGKLPLNGYASIHWLGGIYRNPYAEYDTYSKTVLPNFSDHSSTAFSRTYDVGALAYAFFVTSVLHQSHSSIFSVHPDGGWSIATQAVTYFSGPPAGTGTGSAKNLAVERMRSALVDIVSLRLPATAAQTNAGELGEEARTTHLELINKALDKTYTLADFLPKFELRDWTRKEGEYTYTFLGVPAGFTHFTDTYLVDSVSEKSILVQSTDNYGTPVYRPDMWDHQTGRNTFWSFVIGDTADVRHDKRLVLGGSAMFI